jgi:hypothetical protein
VADLKSDRHQNQLGIYECRALSLAELCDGGRRQSRPRGEVRWLEGRGGVLRGRLTYTILESEDSGLLIGSYWPFGSGASHEVELVLTSEPGKRSTALCPTPGCARAVRTLYAPPGAELLRCRICCGLVYRVSPRQQSEAYVEEIAGPTLHDLAGLPEGALPVPQQPRRARLPAELAARLEQERCLGEQELRLWCLRLRQEGLSYRRIADLVDCSKSSVARYCAAGWAGIDREALARERQERAATQPLFWPGDDPRLREAWARFLRLRALRQSLRRPSPEECEERVLLAVEEP